MISLKKSYARHLLQLALTLSLLRVDPEIYMGYGWESQLALQNGDGWQLELRAAPFNDFPYSNRKALIPLIEDLVRFDRQTHPSTYDVQTYLLNVQNEQISLSSVPLASTSTIESNTSISMPNQQQLPQQITNEHRTRNTTDSNVSVVSDLNDLFALNIDQYADSVSVFDQNVADLNDYNNTDHVDGNGARNDEQWNFNQLYAGLPLKDEPPELFADDRFDLLRQFNDNDNNAELSALSAAGTSNDYPSNNNNISNNYRLYGMRNIESPTVNLTRVIEWSDYFANATKNEEPDTANNTDDATKIKIEATEMNDTMSHVRVKSESEGDDDAFDDSKNSTSGFSSNVELTEEESEIVEVLWKQDVDLGYTLTPPVKSSPTQESANASSSTSFNADDNEKLKVLQELKNDKPKQEENKTLLEDEWAGISFTVDNETGEYIQLPLQLEEILQDVLQLADLAAENDQVDEIIAEELKKSEYSDVGATATTSNFAFGNDQFANVQSKPEVDHTNENNCGDDNEIPLLLSPPLSDEELSADLSAIINEASDLDELDMMIQSAGPFQHPRSVAQNYPGHGTPSTINMYRQPSYHPHSHHHHHHHQSRLRAAAAASMEQRRLDIASLFSPLPGMGMNVTDIAAYSHYPPHYSYQGATSLSQHDQYAAHQHMALHNATNDMAANQSIGSLGSTIPSLSTQQPYYAAPNLGTAVSSSMHLTNSSHDNDVLGATSNYKSEHEYYYSNTSNSELNHTTDGFINQILNNEDLLMDMGVNDDGFYTMRMLEPNATSNNSSILNAAPNVAGSINGVASLIQNAAGAPPMQTNLNSTATDASSDSAVSSMGSERVPSLSDGEWGDTGSDSAQEYHHSKYGPYDCSSYNGRLSDAVRHPVAQKKHQMFGKRYLQDQTSTPNMPQTASNAGIVGPPQQPDMPIKYEFEPYPMHHPLATNLDGAAGGMPVMNKHLSQQQSAADMKYYQVVGHNHTYTLPQASGATPRSQTRDKKNSKKHDDEHLSRDEKRARASNVPISVMDIINLPMDEFNERLSKYDLSESQLSLIRDIRRRGKNKVAAQNCRKRKLDQIISLADEVDQVRKRKERLVNDQEAALSERKRIVKKFQDLYKHIFANLRDPQGNLYSQNDWNLQQSNDGRVHLLPRENRNNANQVNDLNQQHHAQMQQSQQAPNSQANSTHHLSHHHNNPHHHH